MQVDAESKASWFARGLNRKPTGANCKKGFARV
uniref:Uncharacterized protein n=1 Tax=Anguilla anguilla TaxID=7936 RepID=A0A0E9QBI2_ANGAN